MTTNKNSTKYYSQKHEESVAKALKGSVVKGSGASKFSLGDVRVSDKILIECKTSTEEKQSYSVKKSVLEKIAQESREMRRYFSILAFNFGPNTENYYIIDEDTVKFLVECINENYN